MSEHTKVREALETVYQDVPLADVMEYFAAGFSADVRRCEYFVDPFKQRVVFRLLVAPAPLARVDTQPEPGEFVYQMDGATTMQIDGRPAQTPAPGYAHVLPENPAEVE